MRYRCTTCNFSWRTVGDVVPDICPKCGKKRTEERERHFEAAESQELPPLPSSQRYIRFVTRKYLGALEEFYRSIQSDNSFTVHTTREVVDKLTDFEGFLGRIGLPLEIEVPSRVDDDASTLVRSSLREALTKLEEAKESIEKIC